jgi:hypothetical protein
MAKLCTRPMPFNMTHTQAHCHDTVPSTLSRHTKCMVTTLSDYSVPPQLVGPRYAAYSPGNTSVTCHQPGRSAYAATSEIFVNQGSAFPNPLQALLAAPARPTSAVSSPPTPISESYTDGPCGLWHRTRRGAQKLLPPPPVAPLGRRAPRRLHQAWRRAQPALSAG